MRAFGVRLKSAAVFSMVALGACDPPRPTPSPRTDARVADSAAARPHHTDAGATPPLGDAGRVPRVQTPEPTDAQRSAYTRGVNAFGLALYARLREPTGNGVFSPASIAVALAMTEAGARGETATQLRRVMHLPADPDGVHRAIGALVRDWNTDTQGFELHAANRLFGQTGAAVDPAFVALTRDTYGAPIEPMDFASDAEGCRSRINAWVSSQTRHRIEDLLPPDSVNGARLVLTNAIYLHAEWLSPFDRDDSHDDTFFVSPRRTASVPTMHMTGELAYAHRDGVRVLTLPYEAERYALTVVLPDARDGLDGVLGALTTSRLDAWLRAPRTARVVVSLPRFRVENAAPLRLRTALTALGAPLPFDCDAADFSGIAPPRPGGDGLCISDVYHRAFLALDEDGTEAAAATAVVATTHGARRGHPEPQPEIFKADHPFLFVLRDTESGAVLFLGHVRDPG